MGINNVTLWPLQLAGHKNTVNEPVFPKTPQRAKMVQFYFNER